VSLYSIRWRFTEFATNINVGESHKRYPRSLSKTRLALITDLEDKGVRIISIEEPDFDIERMIVPLIHEVFEKRRQLEK
jgi:hypothetical protein